MNVFLNFSNCKGSISRFLLLLLDCLFSKTLLQMNTCKWNFCSSYHNSFSFFNVCIFTLHQTIVFLLRESVPAFFFLNNVQNWCADLFIKRRASLTEWHYLNPNMLFSKSLSSSLSANRASNLTV